jgi:dihydroorotase (multifunctional complex type)
LSAEPADLTIRSRRIHTPDGWRDGVLVVRGETIDGVVAPDAAPQARRHIDATNQVVLPGLIDTHVHVRDPGFTEKEDWESATRAAAAGGVTTVIDMPNVNPVPNTVEAFRAHTANAASKAIVDFGHNASCTIPEQIAGLAEAGATAFKIFMMTDIGRSYPHMPGTAVSDHATLFRIAEEVAKTGKTLLIHPWDQSLYELMVQRAQAQWGMDHRSYARAARQANGIVLDSGVQTMILIQRETGARMHMLHMMTKGMIQMVRDAQARGQAVTAEANPHSLFVANSWDNIEKWGPYVLGLWVPDDHAEVLWDATINGGIDVIATDHSPHTKAEKERGWTDMYATPGGSPMVQHYLSLMLTAVNDGRIGLDRVVELCCAAPARLCNVYPRKGVLAPGSDADIVVVDLDREMTIRAEETYYKCGWTALDGRTVKGVPTMTVLRGQVIAEDGKVLAGPGNGRPVTLPAGATAAAGSVTA